MFLFARHWVVRRFYRLKLVLRSAEPNIATDDTTFIPTLISTLISTTVVPIISTDKNTINAAFSPTTVVPNFATNLSALKATNLSASKLSFYAAIRTTIQNSHNATIYAAQ